MALSRRMAGHAGLALVLRQQRVEPVALMDGAARSPEDQLVLNGVTASDDNLNGVRLAEHVPVLVLGGVEFVGRTAVQLSQTRRSVRVVSDEPPLGQRNRLLVPLHTGPERKRRALILRRLRLGPRLGVRVSLENAQGH